MKVYAALLFLPVLSAADVRVTGPGTRPQLVFACELADGPLETLFSDPSVIADVRDLNAGLSLALVDLSAKRAGVIKRLNQAGIPVIAWMALPAAEGYYLNAGNEPQAAARFAQFERWTSENDLHWTGIGLDIEPNIQEFSAGAGKIAALLLRRYFDWSRVQRARRDYAGLIARMQSSGYPVQTYQFPFIADERKVHSTVLERVAGLVDVRGNEEALMIYSSFTRGAGAAPVWKYGPDAQAIVVGVTSGDAAPPYFVPLDWNQLASNLIVASHFTRVVGVYSLEGCVQHGFLPRIKTMDWNATVTIPAASVARLSRLRFFIQAALWTASWLPLIAAALAGAVWLMWRKRRRRRTSA